MSLKINAKFGFKSEIDVAAYQLITNTELGPFFGSGAIALLVPRQPHF